MASWAGLQQAEVLAVLRDLSAAGCRVWVAGGWAVDVLVGRQTRSHRDLDLAVHAEDEAPTVRVLEDRGYRVETDWRPVRVELARPGGGWVDLHPVDFDDAGNGRQAQLEGGGFDYPRSAFTSGLLAGVEVACLSFAQQVAFRRGYELRPVDLHDLRALDARGPSATEGGPARIVDEATVTAGLPRLLAQAWEAAPLELTRSSGPVGMGSVTTGVTVQGIGAFVVKWVPEAAAGALDRGSAAAAELEQVGLSVGAALPTSGSRLSAPFHGGRAALLRRVDGHPLSGTAADQERMAQVLSRVHAARRPRASDDRYEDAALASASGVEPWVVPSVTAVRDEYGRLPALTWGLVHHDPAPEAFFHDAASGVTSLIDWTGAGDGPLLFDVASAVMYLGGRQRSRSFLDTYLRLASQSLQAEAAEHLGFLARLRGAVQAAYFSRRAAAADLTGVSSQADNLAGLHHARRMLVAVGLEAAVLPASTWTKPVLRPMRLEDLCAVGAVQEEGSIAALSHIFRQSTNPFPREALRARWRRELADPGLDSFVVNGADGEVAGFAVLRDDELLHFGTALTTWGSGLARRAHDELVHQLRDRGHARAHLWVFEENQHARRFYGHRGWRPTGARTTSAFEPRPVLLGYELALTG